MWTKQIERLRLVFPEGGQLEAALVASRQDSWLRRLIPLHPIATPTVAGDAWSGDTGKRSFAME